MGGVRVTSLEQYVERLATELQKPVPDVGAALALRAEASPAMKGKVLAEALGISLELAQKVGGRYEFARRKLAVNGLARPIEPPPVPAEFREAMVVVAAVEKLRLRRLALESQIDDIKKEQAGIDEEMRKYQPVLEKCSLLTKAVQQMRDAVRNTH